MTTEVVQYCYAIARPFPGEALSELPGVGHAAVTLVGGGGLVAVVSAVPAAEFGEAGLRANLEKLAWLEEVARAHNHVVDTVARHTTVLPFRLATLYRDEQRVRDVLHAERMPLLGALDKVTGRVEWGVKVYTRSQPREEPAPEQDGEAPGRAYLRRRRAARKSTEDAWQDAAESAQRIDETLTPLAEDRHVHRPQTPELTGVREQNVLNVAYLVADASRERFLDRISELREQSPGCRIEVTGPWVPYSFALGDLGAPA